jgi:hypothetical protein
MEAPNTNLKIDLLGFDVHRADLLPVLGPLASICSEHRDLSVKRAAYFF